MKMIFETPTASSTMRLTLDGYKVIRDHSRLPDRLRGWNVHIIGDEGRMIFHGTRNEIATVTDALNTMLAKIDREANDHNREKRQKETEKMRTTTSKRENTEESA